MGPAYRSNLVILHKVADYYNELFHHVSISFIEILRYKHEIYNLGFELGHRAHRD